MLVYWQHLQPPVPSQLLCPLSQYITWIVPLIYGLEWTKHILISGLDQYTTNWIYCNIARIKIPNLIIPIIYNWVRFAKMCRRTKREQMLHWIWLTAVQAVPCDYVYCWYCNGNKFSIYLAALIQNYSQQLSQEKVSQPVNASCLWRHFLRSLFGSEVQFQSINVNKVPEKKSSVYKSVHFPSKASPSVDVSTFSIWLYKLTEHRGFCFY